MELTKNKAIVWIPLLTVLIATSLFVILKAEPLPPLDDPETWSVHFTDELSETISYNGGEFKIKNNLKNPAGTGGNVEETDSHPIVIHYTPPGDKRTTTDPLQPGDTTWVEGEEGTTIVITIATSGDDCQWATGTHQRMLASAPPEPL